MKKHIFWGILLLLCAVLLIIDKLVGFGGLSVVNLLFGAVFVALFINGVCHVSFGEMLFSLACLAIIFDEELGITMLTPWTVLAVAALGTVGLNLIFGSAKSRKWGRKWEEKWEKHQNSHIINDGQPHAETFTAEKFYSETNFSSSVKYIHANTFLKGRVECNFGACEVFFDNIEGYQGNGELKLEANFGKITVYVPSHWLIVDHTTSSFGGTHMKRPQPDAGPVLTIKGEANFGGIEIRNT